MARERISEYKAKRMILGESYSGIALSGSTDPYFTSGKEGKYVVKVDQGVKKRFLQGLLKTNVSLEEARLAIIEWEKLGYSNFILETMVPHEATEERYFSAERVRDGIRVLYGEQGGVHIESEGTVTTYLITDTASYTPLITLGIPESFLAKIFALIHDEYVSFIEINPLLITKDGILLLDAAVLVDGAGVFFARTWNEDDLIHPRNKFEEERAVADLQRSTAASLKFTVMNPDGALFFLLSGGGGSIVALDAVHEKGQGAQIGNFGEYSGGPTREETYLYSKAVLSCMLRSKAPKKALVIAGGVANFTDVAKTFSGVVDALTEVAGEMRAQHIHVFVRRGGPNETEGLSAIRTFLEKEGLFGSVHGSESPITTAVIEATDFITHTS